MKALIIYMSRHGSTEKIALYLQAHLPYPTDLLHLESGSQKPDLQPYDVIILGGSIHMGTIQAGIIELCKTHEQELMQKQLGLYICCMNEQQAVETFKASFPETLRKHAKATGILGGELLFEKMSFLEKVVVRTVAGQKESVSKIKYDAIDEFVNAMSAEVEAAAEE